MTREHKMETWLSKEGVEWEIVLRRMKSGNGYVLPRP